MGVQAGGSGNPDSWRLGFPNLDAYRDAWLAGTIDQNDFAEELRPALFRVSMMRDIEINGDKALAHKKFDGRVARQDGTFMVFKWQSIAYSAQRAAIAGVSSASPATCPTRSASEDVACASSSAASRPK